MKMLLRLALLLILSTANNVYSQSRVLSKGDFKGLPQQYQSIDDPKANSFLQQGLSYAIELYGEPRIPVRKVFLKYRPQGALTNLTDSGDGIFTIFLSHKPNEYSFYGQLAHEVAHLLNAQIYDAYVEGLNTVFSEKLLKRTGKDWSRWEEYYRKNEAPFYATTYFMMKEVSEVAGDRAMSNFLSYAKYNSENSQRMYIDIEEWIDSLPREKRAKVRNVILKYASNVQKSMDGIHEEYTFILPE
jgi:hypothetical protein